MEENKRRFTKPTTDLNTKNSNKNFIKKTKLRMQQ
jgi:hypothetical protein